ncbi:hypothetical protein ACFSM8_08760, partial [Microbacterium laevaniformans]
MPSCAPGVMDDARPEAVAAIIAHAAAVNGYALVNAASDWDAIDPKMVTVTTRSEVDEMCMAQWCG